MLWGAHVGSLELRTEGGETRLRATFPYGRETVLAERVGKPTSLEGIGALAALAWVYVNPGCTDPEEFAEQAKSYDCRAVMAIWKACTGLDGYPVT